MFTKMIKKIITSSLLFLSILTYGQIKEQELGTIQVIGVRSDISEPSTLTKLECDSIIFISQQKDPFFILEKTSPSIYSQSDNGQGNGYSYLRMRGLDQTRINFNLNGIPLNEMEDQGIYFSNIPGFYNYLSSINVQRGVGTSKFGQTSIGGSVNMESKDITKKDLEVNFLVRSSLPNDQFYNFYYSPGIDKNGFSYQIGGTCMKNEGFKEHSINDGGSVFYGLESVRKNNIFKFYGINGITHNQLAFNGISMDSLLIKYNTNTNLITDKDTFHQNLFCFNWINFKGDVKFNTSTYFNNVNGHYNTLNTLFGVNSYQYGAMTNMVYTNSTNSTFNIGLNTNIYKRYHFGYDNNGYYDYPSNTKMYENYGYKEDAIAFVRVNQKSEDVDIFFDLQGRSVWFNTTNSKMRYNWMFLNPKFGINFIKPNNNVYITLGFTQREPTRTDMTQDIIQKNSLSYGNPDNSIFLSQFKSTLVPEKVTDVEVGNSFHNKIFNINCNFYLMTIENEFIATGQIDPYSGFMNKKSVNSTFRSGIESDGKVLFDKLNIFYTLNYQYSQIFDSIYTKSIPFNPNFISTFGLSIKENRVKVGLYEQYVSSMAMNYNNGVEQIFSDPYQTLNAFFEYQYEKINIGFKLNNILNQKIYIPGGVSGTIPTYYVGQLQNWSINIRYKF